MLAVAGLIGKGSVIENTSSIPVLCSDDRSAGYGIVNLSSGVFNAGFAVVAAIVATMIYYIYKYNKVSTS